MTDQQPAPFAYDLEAFLALETPERTPILGTPHKQLIVTGGLTLLGAKAGIGKTTLVVDLAYHLASGHDWLNQTAGEPLNILFIENEGPQALFQQKLREKHAAWQHAISGQIHIQTLRWGSFNFADINLHKQLADYLDEHQIDLIIGDPLGTLGVKGVGSPEDTREFVKHLVPLGLFTTRTFLFLVHFAKEPRQDEIDQISGSWGGHLDSLLILKTTPRPDELRLSFPKLRWWRDTPPKPLILGKVYNTATFELLGEEGEHRDLEQDIIEHLKGGLWRTLKEIASSKRGGVGAREAEVKQILEARTDLFAWQSGSDHGRSARSIVWGLLPQHGSSAEPWEPSAANPAPKPGSSNPTAPITGALQTPNDLFTSTAPSAGSSREQSGAVPSGGGAVTAPDPHPYRGEGSRSSAPLLQDPGAVNGDAHDQDTVDELLLRHADIAHPNQDDEPDFS